MGAIGSRATGRAAVRRSSRAQRARTSRARFWAQRAAPSRDAVRHHEVMLVTIASIAALIRARAGAPKTASCWSSANALAYTAISEGRVMAISADRGLDQHTVGVKDPERLQQPDGALGDDHGRLLCMDFPHSGGRTTDDEDPMPVALFRRDVLYSPLVASA